MKRYISLRLNQVLVAKATKFIKIKTVYDQMLITLTCLAQGCFFIICPLQSNSNLVPHEAEE